MGRAVKLSASGGVRVLVAKSVAVAVVASSVGVPSLLSVSDASAVSPVSTVSSSLQGPRAVVVDGGRLFTVSGGSDASVLSPVVTPVSVDEATLSPDRSTVVFSAPAGKPTGLYRLSLGSSDAVKVFSSPWVSDPSFSADGKSVVVATRGASKPTKRPFVAVLDVNGKVLSEARQLQPAYDPALSPDGKSVAYAGGVRGVDTRYPLMLASLAPGSVPSTVAVSAPGQGGVSDVAWSSDGKVIGATKFTLDHYGVALFTPWGSCSRDVLFANQPPGRNNGLLYRFGGFADSSSTMWTLLEDSQSQPARQRLFRFDADVCSATSTPPLEPLVAESFSQLSDVSVPDVATASPWVPQLSQAIAVSQRNGSLQVTFRAPSWPLGALSTMVRFAPQVAPSSPTEGTLAFAGFEPAGASPQVAPSTTYGVSVFTFSPDGSWRVDSTTYRTPDATAFADVSSKRSGDSVQVSGRLVDVLSKFALPFAFVELQALRDGEFQAVGASSTDADGKFSLSGYVTGSPALRLVYSGDSDRFAAVLPLAKAKPSVTVKLNGRVAVSGSRVTVPLKFTVDPLVKVAYNVELRSGARWRSVASGKVADAATVVSVSVPVPSSGQASIRVRLGGGAQSQPAVSKVLQVRVPR